ncbi:zinc metalloprotease, partial [Dispira parvispora]
MVSHDDLVFGAYLVGVCVSFPLIMMLVIVNVQLFPLLDQFGVPCPAFLTGSWEGLFNAAVADPLATYVVPHFPEPLANLATSLAQSRDALSDYVDAVALEGILWFQRVWENVGTLSCSEALQQGLVGLGLPEATVSTWFAQPFPYKEFVLGVALVVYLFETYLDYRQHRKLRERVRPATITTIVSQEDFEKANEYGLDKSRFHFVRAFVNQLQTVALLWYDVLPLLWDLVGSTMLHYAGLGSEYEITHSVLFFMFTAFLTSVLSIPFDFYHTFVIEERHGFNKQTPALYFTDLVKNYLVGAVIGVPVIAALLRIVQWAGPYFYVYIWVFVMGLQFLLMTIYPTLI